MLALQVRAPGVVPSGLEGCPAGSGPGSGAPSPVPDAVRVDTRVGCALALGQVGEEATHPIGAAGLGAIGVVAGAQAQAELLEGGRGIRTARLVHDLTRGAAMPVGAAEEVDEVNAQGLLGLADLPVVAPWRSRSSQNRRTWSARGSGEAVRFRKLRTQRMQ